MNLISMFRLGWTSIMAADFDDGQDEPPGDFIEDFDEDGDGMVSEEEFPGPEDHFIRLDQDEDGFITEDEKPDGAAPEPIGAFDEDGDGHLSIDEFPGAGRRIPNIWNSNGDGYIDEDEVPRDLRARAPDPAERLG